MDCFASLLITWMASESSATRRDYLLALLAEALDAERDHITDFEEFRCRLHAGADAGRRACGDDVAGQQGEECRDVGNALRYREDHGRGRTGLEAPDLGVRTHWVHVH